MNQSEEKRCIQQAQNGDMRAFEALVTEHERFVYHIALKLLNNPHDAEDAAQETFLKAYTSLSHFRGESKFSVWLYRLASNVCIDMLRRKNVGTVSLSAGDGEGEDVQLDIADTRFQPETELEKKELRRAINQGLSQLPDNYRQALILRELGGQSYEEIASALQLDLGTVKSRIFRARKKLCAILLSNGNIFAPNPSKSGKGGGQE